MELFKKKNIKTINNKMAINTYLSIIESKKKPNYANKIRDRIMDTESILTVDKWEGGVGMDEEVGD